MQIPRNFQIVINSQLSPADRYALVAQAALVNERNQHRRFGTTSLALYVDAAATHSTTEQVLLSGCRAFVDSVTVTVFANEYFAGVYEHWVQIWEEKATYSFEQWRRQDGMILARKACA